MGLKISFTLYAYFSIKVSYIAIVVEFDLTIVLLIS